MKPKAFFTIDDGRQYYFELLTAARAVELRKELKPAKPTQAVISELRKVVDPIGPDRFLSPEMERATLVIKEGRAVSAAKAIVTTLS